MLKILLPLIAASIIVIFGAHYFSIGCHYLAYLHNLLTQLMAKVFAGGTIGSLIRQILGLILIPLIIGFIIDGIYWLILKRHAPYLSSIIWGIWLILAILLVTHK